MKKLILISSLLLSTTAFAGNILPLNPGVATNNVMFNNVVAMQVEKSHPVHKDIKKGKPTNKLESSDEFPSVDEYFEGPLPEVVINDGPGDGGLSVDIVQVDHFEFGGLDEEPTDPTDLEPRCACVGNIFVDPIRPPD